MIEDLLTHGWWLLLLILVLGLIGYNDHMGE
jgi:hypothetical protein